MLLDIHTHRQLPQPEGIYSICLGEEKIEFIDNQYYSLGIHPWTAARNGMAPEGMDEDLTETLFNELEMNAGREDVLAIGECGVDLGPKGGPLYKQLLLFKRHVALSEKIGKPLIIHEVKAHDIIAGARRDLKPAQNWAIHGFRRNAATAAMLLRAGCWISFGPEFNVEALQSMPSDLILAETDASDLTIEEVIGRISAARGEDMTEHIAANTARFLGRGE